MSGRTKWRAVLVLAAALGALALPAGAQDDESEPREPWKLYGGLDYALPTLSLSDAALSAAFGRRELDSSMLRLRAGARFFNWIGVELQLGAGSGDAEAADEYEVASYGGLFFAPTGLLFDTLEVAALVGVTHFKAERGSASETFGGPAFGVNAELPLRRLAEGLPDIRLGGGYIVYDHNNRHRIYGAHAGLRYDFQW
jgi:hypothetical protein